MLLVANLFRYMCAKNYQNIAWFDKVIAIINGVVSVHMVYKALYKYYCSVYFTLLYISAGHAQ